MRIKLDSCKSVDDNGFSQNFYLCSLAVHQQAPGERNYHVFYEMLAGMSPAEKAKLGLFDAERYHYLNQGSRSSKMLGKPDSEDFLSLVRALDVLSFSPVEQDTIFGILAAILHLGNINFQAAQVSVLMTNFD